MIAHEVIYTKHRLEPDGEIELVIMETDAFKISHTMRVLKPVKD